MTSRLPAAVLTGLLFAMLSITSIAWIQPGQLASWLILIARALVYCSGYFFARNLLPLLLPKLWGKR